MDRREKREREALRKEGRREGEERKGLESVRKGGKRGRKGHLEVQLYNYRS